MEEEPIEVIEEEEKPSILRKIFIAILGIFLIILILSFFLTNSSIRNILSGLIESGEVQNNIVYINSTNKLIFQSNTYNELLGIYYDHPGVEFKVCLHGDIKKGDYLINKIIIPETFLQTHNKVISEPCSQETIVDMHSHPLKHCLPSNQDLNNFKRFKERNKNVILAIMCEPGRFNLYN